MGFEGYDCAAALPPDCAAAITAANMPVKIFMAAFPYARC